MNMMKEYVQKFKAKVIFHTFLSSLYIMYVFCVHMYSYMPVSRTSLWTRSTVLCMRLDEALRKHDAVV